MIKEIGSMYIREKLDLIESTLQLIHSENVAIAKAISYPNVAKSIETSWNEKMDELIEKYKDNTRMEGHEDGN